MRGMRIRLSDMLDLLATGLSAEQVLVELPDLEREDIDAVLHFASIHGATGSSQCDPSARRASFSDVRVSYRPELNRIALTTK